MFKIEYILLFILVILSSCKGTVNESNTNVIYDIVHYCEFTERQISLVAMEIELDGMLPHDVNGFKKLDSCLFLRKQLFKINGDSIVVLSNSKSQYLNYLAFLNAINKPEKQKELEKLLEESTLDEIPSKIDLKYILNLVRFEYSVVKKYLPSISPTYCGWGNRVFAMQDDIPFSEHQIVDVLLISDFSTSRVSDFRFSFFVDSVKLGNEKLNNVMALNTIDRIAHLKMQIPIKGNYKIYGRTKLSWKSQQDSSTLPIDDYPFFTVISIE